MRKRYTAAFAIAFIATAAVFVVSAQDSSNSDEEANVEREILMAVTSGRIRSAPSLQGKILRESTLGTRFKAIAEKNGWDEVRLESTGDDEKTGWISRSITQPYDRVKPGVQMQAIAGKYFARKKMRFSTAKQLFEALPGAADEAKTFEIGGDLRLKSLEALSIALKTIPFGKEKASPYKEFLEKYKTDVVYSEPAGEWYVRADRFWELHGRYKKHKVGEEIAWRAAANPIPGECEGYINCYLYLLRVTQGEYMNFYPSGKYSRQALLNMRAMLQPIVSDVRTKTVYYTTSDVSDRAEFNKMLSELRKIVASTPFVEKQLVLKQIADIAEGYR